jgi:hypothetical protein
LSARLIKSRMPATTITETMAISTLVMDKAPVLAPARALCKVTMQPVANMRRICFLPLVTALGSHAVAPPVLYVMIGYGGHVGIETG